MSKKNVLSEVRRFMKLANLDANLSSSFVNKLDEMGHAYERKEEMMQEEEVEAEEEVEIEEPMGMDDMDDMDDEIDMDDMDDEIDMDAEEEPAGEADEAVLTDDEADAIIALADKLRAARSAPEGEEELDMGMDMDDEEVMGEQDATLEEILEDVLSEDEEPDAQVTEEELVQEVLRRVKTRLAAMSKK